MTINVLSRALRENLFTPDDVPRFEAKLFYEGDRRRPYLERFGVLLFLAATIATMGVLGDSTATVIGAMIVAPLMTPIMATAAGLIMADVPRAARSLALVAAGVAGVILLALCIGFLMPIVTDFARNTQVVSRTSPRFIDLVAALASGAAGAFCLSRDDIADSLPGVAISISLVPPLCVVGLALADGQYDAASGAMLLFTTNFLAILLAGGGLLAVLGLNQAATVHAGGTARRNAYIAIAAATILVAIPLSFTGRRISWQQGAELSSRAAATAWLEGSDYEVRLVEARSKVISLAIIGEGEVPPFASLVGAIRARVGRDVNVELEVIESKEMSTLSGG